MRKARIAVLVSGGGTNLQAILDASAAGKIPHGEVVLVVSNKEDAYALERAKKANVAGVTLTKKQLGSQEAFETALTKTLTDYGVELIVLAGFLSILSETFTSRWPRRILNIHPSLIPSFCGDGFYGERVHQAAIDHGVKISGATVHFVDEGTDTGPIIMQASVPVLQDDDAKSLAARVLVQEHKLLPLAVRLFLEDKIEVCGRQVRITQEGSLEK